MRMLDKNLIDSVIAGETTEVTKYLDQGADINVVDDGAENTLLHLAILMERKEAFLLLLRLKLDINKVNAAGETPLAVAIMASKKWFVDILLTSLANVNIADLYDITPLHYAVVMRDDSLVDKLLALQADVNAVDADNMSPLCYTHRCFDDKIFYSLIKAGADVNFKGLHKTMVEWSRLDLVARLEFHGANFDHNAALLERLYNNQDTFFSHVSNDDIASSLKLLGNKTPVFCKYLLDFADKLENTNRPAAISLQAMNKKLFLIMTTFNVFSVEKPLKIIKGELQKEGSVAFSSGWISGNEGHEIIAELKYNQSRDLILIMHNSGSGRHFHRKKEVTTTKTSFLFFTSKLVVSRFASGLIYKVPKDKCNSDVVDELIKMLIEPICVYAPSERKQISGCVAFYNNIANTLNALGIVIDEEPAEYGVYYTRGQRSGTCTWKSLMAFVKNTIQNDKKYLLLKYEIKLNSLLTYYQQQVDNERINHEIVKKQIVNACDNLERLIKKLEIICGNAFDANVRVRTDVGRQALKDLRLELGRNDRRLWY